MLPFIVFASFQEATLIIAESSLRFLGHGVPVSEPTWRAMFADEREYTTEDMWITMFPGLMLMLVALCTNLFEDGLKEVLALN